MTPTDPFDRALAAWLHDEASGATPRYLDEILERTDGARQRPAWSSPGRWVPGWPLIALPRARRLAWLLVVVGLLAALATAAILIGSRDPRPLPPPFGPADNGILAYSTSDGDINGYDIVSGRIQPIVTGPPRDAWPAFSRDGTRLKVERAAVRAGEVDIVIAKSDGSSARTVIGGLSDIATLDMTADGSKLAIVARLDGTLGAWIVDVDGRAAPRRLDIGMTITAMEFRPDGARLVFAAKPSAACGAPTNTPDGCDLMGLYEIGVDGTGLRTIATSTEEFIAAGLSPDGSKVAYMTWDATKAVQGVLHVIDVDSGVMSTPAFDGQTTADEQPMWAPDSEGLVFERYLDDRFRLAIGSIHGGPVVEIGPVHRGGDGGSDHQFSPDGTAVIATYHDDGSTWLLDVRGTTETRLSIESSTTPTWQRGAH